MALARRRHRQLIHDPARDARELVLGDLRELRRRPWFPRQVRRRRQRARHGNFERRGRGQAGANRYVSGNGQIGAAKCEPGTQHRPRNPGDITEPAAASAAPGLAGRPLRQGVERDLPPLAELQRTGAQQAIRARRECHDDMAIDGHRQHEAVVVVGVLANQVDAARRGGHRRLAGAIEGAGEFLPRPLHELKADHTG